jgi:hypothetical protein
VRDIVCTVQNCGLRPGSILMPTHADATCLAGTSFGALCEARCKPGFLPIAPDDTSAFLFSCGPDGAWAREPPGRDAFICQPRSCPTEVPGMPLGCNAVCLNRLFGEPPCVVGCAPGWTGGTTNIVCGPDGAWIPQAAPEESQSPWPVCRRRKCSVTVSSVVSRSPSLSCILSCSPACLSVPMFTVHCLCSLLGLPVKGVHFRSVLEFYPFQNSLVTSSRKLEFFIDLSNLVLSFVYPCSCSPHPLKLRFLQIHGTSLCTDDRRFYIERSQTPGLVPPEGQPCRTTCDVGFRGVSHTGSPAEIGQAAHYYCSRVDEDGSVSWEAWPPRTWTCERHPDASLCMQLEAPTAQTCTAASRCAFFPSMPARCTPALQQCAQITAPTALNCTAAIHCAFIPSEDGEPASCVPAPQSCSDVDGPTMENCTAANHCNFQPAAPARCEARVSTESCNGLALINRKTCLIENDCVFTPGTELLCEVATGTMPSLEGTPYRWV